MQRRPHFYYTKTFNGKREEFITVKTLGDIKTEPKRRGRPPKSEAEKAEEREQREVERLNQWREEMRQKWGSRYDSDGNPRDYSDAELKELENFYNAMYAEYSEGITTRQKNGIIEISGYRLELKRCIAEGDSAGAKRYSDMINSAMTREAMKAGDVKALEVTRIDSLIVNLEKKGAIKNHKIVGKAELIDILAKDHPQYKTSKDVVDSMMFRIINTMRRNNGESELDKLPISAQVEDAFGELLTMPSHKERQAMAETGVVTPQREQPYGKIE